MLRKPLNIQQRHDVYKDLLDIMLRKYIMPKGLCGYLDMMVDNQSGMPLNWLHASSQDKLEFYLPELLAQKPLVTYDRWFWFSRDEEGFWKRIEAVKKAIELTRYF